MVIAYNKIPDCFIIEKYEYTPHKSKQIYVTSRAAPRA
jgi:hypothetical protein